MHPPRDCRVGNQWAEKGPGLRMLWVCLLVVLLAACKPSSLNTPVVSPAAVESPVPTPTPLLALENPEISSTALPVPVEITPAPLVRRETPSSAIEPLRFVFPTPGPQPASAWRPPLYPTPWALSPFDHFYFARPIAADEVNWPLWDYRYGGSFFDNVVHTGIDIPARIGTPVLAAGSGKVTWAGYGLYRGFEDRTDPYGIALAIRHDFGYQGQTLYTVYGHLSEVDVVKGQYVEVGQLLGLSGDTGKVTGPHLHFEVRIGKNDFFTTQNPELWLVPPQGWGVLVGKVLGTGGLRLSGQEVILKSKADGQNWMAKSYGPEAINSDAYYNENVVISDIPAGSYEVRIPYIGMNYILDIEIHPGTISYFTFKGRYGYDTQLPPVPGASFTPVP